MSPHWKEGGWWGRGGRREIYPYNSRSLIYKYRWNNGNNNKKSLSNHIVVADLGRTLILVVRSLMMNRILVWPQIVSTQNTHQLQKEKQWLTVKKSRDTWKMSTWPHDQGYGTG